MTRTVGAPTTCRAVEPYRLRMCKVDTVIPLSFFSSEIVIPACMITGECLQVVGAGHSWSGGFQVVSTGTIPTNARRLPSKKPASSVTQAQTIHRHSDWLINARDT